MRREIETEAKGRAGEMAQGLRARAALSEDLGSSPSIHVVAPKHSISGTLKPLLASEDTCKQNTYTHKIKNKTPNDRFKIYRGAPVPIFSLSSDLSPKNTAWSSM